MDSLSTMLNRLKPNDKDFKDRFLDISSVYNAPFDSDTVIQYLRDGILKDNENKGGFIEIPCIEYSKDKNEYILPKNIFIEGNSVPFPDSIEELRGMCKAYGLKIELNNRTAQRLFR